MASAPLTADHLPGPEGANSNLPMETAAALPGPEDTDSSLPMETASSSQPRAQSSCKRHESQQIGYKELSTVACADRSFLVVRQFASLHARIIWMLQDRIRCLELKLKGFENPDNSVESCPGVHHNGSFRHDFHPHRTRILEEIQVALTSYGQFMLSQSRNKFFSYLLVGSFADMY
jgi:hypothetical protein